MVVRSLIRNEIEILKDRVFFLKDKIVSNLRNTDPEYLFLLHIR